jgi:hypothetical protein
VQRERKCESERLKRQAKEWASRRDGLGVKKEREREEKRAGNRKWKAEREA